MQKTAFYVGLSALALTGCEPQAPYHLSQGCPSFPPKQTVQEGGPFASTSFGRMARHATPARHVEVPNGPIGDVRIVLERSGCYGFCPAYSVELRGNGDVLFHGDHFVTFAGDHKTHISPSTIQCLIDDFHIADFWSLDSEYRADATDLPTYGVSLTIGGKSKMLTDYAGQMVGMPASVTALENAIDQAAQSDTWIRGNAATISNLEAEKFDFHGRYAADVLATASQDAPEPVVLGLLDRGAPLDGLVRGGRFEETISATEAAAMNGRLSLLRRLIAAGAFAKGGKALISATLRASVASQKADVVAEVLKYHPDVNGKDKQGDTALALIFTGAHPHAGDDNARDDDAAIIRMLGKAGADPNLQNSEHENLLEQAYFKEDKEALISIGADQRKRLTR